MHLQGHNTTLTAAECRELLVAKTVGRLGWLAAVGPTIQPVVYAVRDNEILFRTAPGTLLATLAEGADVCFQIDDLDEQTATGWSVLVRGTSHRAASGLAARLPAAWAPGERPLVIAVTPGEFSGRAVSADFPAIASHDADIL